MSAPRDDPPGGPAGAPAGGSDTHGAATHVELPLEPVTAFGVEGYDPEDPWNAALCVETETGASLLALTPKTLDALIGALGEVDDAQRRALGIPPSQPQDASEEESPGEAHSFDGVVHRARVLTGSAQLGRLWGESPRGPLVVIGGAILFVVLGILFSVLR